MDTATPLAIDAVVWFAEPVCGECTQAYGWQIVRNVTMVIWTLSCLPSVDYVL